LRLTTAPIALGLAPLAALLLAPAACAAPTPERIGTSAQGRPIVARWAGPRDARAVVLVVGEIHGNERAGIPVTRRLRGVKPPRGTAFVLVDESNPDGAARDTRQNARGVDLNRNFPFAWRGGGLPFDTYYPGEKPLSEPESAALAAFIQRVRPRVTIWYHQQLRLVDRSGGDPFLERLYARRSRLPYKLAGTLPGTATRWQNHRFRGDTAFVVELPAGSLSPVAVSRHSQAVVALAKAVAPPRERSTPIPFGERRRAEMRAYAQRHYDIDRWELRSPRVIVQHWTETDTVRAAYDTFAPDVPDVELGELPGVCAHYVIGKAGDIHRLVPLTTMCRHTVGLNWTAIGIEHVGRRDGQVLGNRRQIAASLRLTRSLQGRFRIATRNVIGHAESLASPYHRERVAALRRQTHDDMKRPAMRRYRRALDRLPRPSSLR
jgi:beta-N-acetylhexosaminidase